MKYLALEAVRGDSMYDVIMRENMLIYGQNLKVLEHKILIFTLRVT